MKNSFREPIHITRPLLPALEKINGKLEEIWKSQWITNNGIQHRKLETQLIEYLGAENLSLFNNGTLALLLGLKALKLEGEVITTPFTFPATVQALDWNGLTPVFCDIEPETLTIDAAKIESLITEKTSAILGVHVFGNPCDVQTIQTIADKYKLKVIYDGAHSFGAKIAGKPISSFGDMTMFSFHATKLFNTVEGGALVFKDSNIKIRLEQLKNFGIANQEEVVMSGLNAKMNEIQAAVGIEVLKLVEDERIARHKIKQQYDTKLASIPGIRVLTNLEDEDSSYQYFAIEIDEDEFGQSRDYIHEKLKDQSIFTRKYFFPLCSDFHWYSHLASAQPHNLLQAQKTVKEVLAMPFYGGLDLKSVSEICEILESLSTNKNAIPKRMISI